MFRLFSLFLIISSSVSLAHGATHVPYTTMARDLTSILEIRSSMDILSPTGKSYTLFTREYFGYLDDFVSRYSPVFRVFALRPTLDLTLSYHLRIQEYRLSCEIAALRIILERLAVIVSEQDIFASIPLFSMPYGSGAIWGDPDTEFVGYYTGSQAGRTGYGIYEAPLAGYARSYGLSSEVVGQSTHVETRDGLPLLSYILGELTTKKKHILLWGDYCTTPSHDDGVIATGGRWMMRLFPLPARNHCDRPSRERMIYWTTPAGKQVTGLSGEHAFVLLGYIGSIDHPTHIIVWDTYTGRHVYSISEWMRKWSLMQYRALIISG